MIRSLPPSGNPVSFVDLLECIRQVNRNPADELVSHISTMLGVRNTFLFSTGRAAMTFLLRSMARRSANSGKNVVVVPSYTCYSVAASVLQAGLSLQICDIDRSTLSYDAELLETIDFERVLAVISCNLYGIPDDLAYLEALAQRHEVFLIDDAAQCLGAEIRGRQAGTFGDAGILSFDKGKVVTTINGGAIVTSNPVLAKDLMSEYAQVDEQTKIKRTMETIKLFAYSVLLRPALYWIPSHMPFLGLGTTRYDDTFPVNRYFDALAPLAVAQLSRLAEMNEHRRRCAARYSSFLPDLPAVEFIETVPGSNPVYLRYPLRIVDQRARCKFLAQNRKLGCSISYPGSIADIPQIREQVQIHNEMCEAGREVSQQLVTLPTHAYVREPDIDRICESLAK